MLAAAVADVGSLPYPMIASPKLDGIRCIVRNGEVLSRKFLPIPNHHVRSTIEGLVKRAKFIFAGSVLDGELIVDGTFQDVSSSIMGRDGAPKFRYVIFDAFGGAVDKKTDYETRLRLVNLWVDGVHKLGNIGACFEAIESKVVHNSGELLAFESKVLRKGYEGVCLRTLKSPYKEGRSTLREGYLLKLKRFTDGEAVIVGTYEQEKNTNEAGQHNTGGTKRSSAKAGKVAKGTLGGFTVRDCTTDVEFNIGTGEGLTEVWRQELWSKRDTLPGKIVRYRHQEVGTKDKPRLPIFTGFRDAADMS